MKSFKTVFIAALFLSGCEGTAVFLTPEFKVTSKDETTHLILLPLDLNHVNKAGNESINLKYYPKNITDTCNIPFVKTQNYPKNKEGIPQKSGAAAATAAFNILLAHGNAAFKKGAENKIGRLNQSYSSFRNIEAHNLNSNTLKCLGLVRRINVSKNDDVKEMKTVSEAIFLLKPFGKGGLIVEPIYTRITRLKSSTIKTIEEESKFSLVATVGYNYIGFDTKPVSYKQSFTSNSIKLKNERVNRKLTGNVVHDPEMPITWRPSSGITPFLKNQPVSIAVSITEVAAGQIGNKEDILKAVDANTKEINTVLGTAFKKLIE